MKISLIAPGAWASSGPEASLFAEYEKRLRRFHWTLDLIQSPRKSTNEAAWLMEKVKGAHPLWILDESGANWSSPAWAERLRELANQGKSSLTLVLGPVNGLRPELRMLADQSIAFGRVTWPHLLMRVLVAEQVYRACTIQQGHPYHRE